MILVILIRKLKILMGLLRLLLIYQNFNIRENFSPFFKILYH
nr:MAG TPA: hypothetical protein [Caudoviricetes sp.]